jgi:hypothetical protein
MSHAHLAGGDTGSPSDKGYVPSDSVNHAGIVKAKTISWKKVFSVGVDLEGD